MANGQANIQTRASLGDLGRRGLGPVFEDVFEQNLIKFEGMNNVQRLVDFNNTDNSVLRTTGLTGYGFLNEFEEGDAIPQDQNIKTFETTFSIRDYGKNITVTDDMIQDRQRLGGKIEEMANLSRMVDITKAKHAMMNFNAAFGTTAQVGGASLHRYNAEQLCTTSHARADGGTAQSNQSATNITLTELNLETQRLLLVKQLTDNGLPTIDMGAITLVVPDDLEKNAVIFTGSKLRASTANNDLNFYQGRINVISSRWLDAIGTNEGSATAWFLVAQLPGQGKALRVYQMGGPRFHQADPDSKTWNLNFSVKNRYAVGNAEWKGIVGSDGTGS